MRDLVGDKNRSTAERPIAETAEDSAATPCEAAWRRSLLAPEAEQDEPLELTPASPFLRPSGNE